MASAGRLPAFDATTFDTIRKGYSGTATDSWVSPVSTGDITLG